MPGRERYRVRRYERLSDSTQRTAVILSLDIRKLSVTPRRKVHRPLIPGEGTSTVNLLREHFHSEHQAGLQLESASRVKTSANQNIRSVPAAPSLSYGRCH